MRSAVEGMEFCLLLLCREVAHFLTGGGHARLPFLSFQNRDTTGHEAAERRTVFIGGRWIPHAGSGAPRRPNKSRTLVRRARRLPFSVRPAPASSPANRHSPNA